MLFSFLSVQRLSGSALTIWCALSTVQHWLDNKDSFSKARKQLEFGKVTIRREAAEEETVRWCGAAVEPQIIAFKALINTGVGLWLINSYIVQERAVRWDIP